MARNRHLTLTLLAVLVFLSLTYVMSNRGEAYSPMHVHDKTVATEYAKDIAESNSGSSNGGRSSSSSSATTNSDPDFMSGISANILQGGSIAPKLENATIKYAPLLY
jgi:FAD-linked sulfhydryl oxidase